MWWFGALPALRGPGCGAERLLFAFCRPCARGCRRGGAARGMPSLILTAPMELLFTNRLICTEVLRFRPYSTMGSLQVLHCAQAGHKRGLDGESTLLDYLSCEHPPLRTTPSLDCAVVRARTPRRMWTSSRDAHERRRKCLVFSTKSCNCVLGTSSTDHRRVQKIYPYYPYH